MLPLALVLVTGSCLERLEGETTELSQLGFRECRGGGVAPESNDLDLSMQADFKVFRLGATDGLSKEKGCGG